MSNIFNQLPGYIGWKDTNLHHLGCNQNLASVLALKNADDIIGRKDSDLIDHTDESNVFHRENDLMVLQGKIITGIHQAVGVYRHSQYYFVKKPLYDFNNNICGIIYHCNEFKPSQLAAHFLEEDPTSSHFRSELPDNKFKLSNRELECLFYTLRGKTARQISEIIKLSKRTIESYLESIKNKTGCQSKADLLVLAVSDGYMKYIPPHIL